MFIYKSIINLCKKKSINNFNLYIYYNKKYSAEKITED